MSEQTNEIKGKKIKIWLKNQFRYVGQCIAIDSEFLTLTDERTGMKLLFNMTEVTQIEVIG